MIVSLLDFSAMCNMRLVSRDISAKATHGIVKSDFLDQSIIWTNASQLKALVTKTAKDWRGCLMGRLTVIGAVTTAPMSSGTTSAEDHDEASLAEAFSNVRQNAPRGYLDTLALQIQRYTDDGHMEDSSHIRSVDLTWDASAQTFAATMRALAASGMPVLRLDLFGSDSPRCALACNRLADILASLDKPLDHSLSLCMLTHLAIGISGALASQSPGELLPEQQAANALLRLVSCCPLLQSLEVRWYNLGTSATANQDVMVISQLVGTSAGRASLQRLLECSLRGIYTTEASLLMYLQNTPHLQTLSLEEVHLVEGTFGSIFHFLSNTTSLEDLQQVYLNDLWEGESHLRFNARGTPHFPSRGVAKPHDMTWLASSRSRPQPIKYILSKGQAYGSAAFNNWRRKRIKSYGPPNARI